MSGTTTTREAGGEARPGPPGDPLVKAVEAVLGAADPQALDLEALASGLGAEDRRAFEAITGWAAKATPERRAGLLAADVVRDCRAVAALPGPAAAEAP